MYYDKATPKYCFSTQIKKMKIIEKHDLRKYQIQSNKKMKIIEKQDLRKYQIQPKIETRQTEKHKS